MNSKSILVNGFKSINCLQTENEIIQCSFTKVMPKDLFVVLLYSDLREISRHQIASVSDSTFNKIFLIKGEIGAYVYFEKSTNIPTIQIKEVKGTSLVDVFSYKKINGEGTYTLNNGLFYSDGIKITDSQIGVFLTTH